MEYNTQKNKLVLPEYGRNIQMMVEHAMTLPDRSERLQCAQRIIDTMAMTLPKNTQKANVEQMLWDHLALISNYQLDIDWPFPITRSDEVARPEAIPYPEKDIHLRHYGQYVEDLVAQICQMEEGDERNRLIELAANQLRKDLYYWNKSSLSEQRIADDLLRMSKGMIDIRNMQIVYSRTMPTGNSQNGKKSKRR